MKKELEVKKPKKSKRFWDNLGFYGGVFSLTGAMLLAVGVAVDPDTMVGKAACVVAVWFATSSNYLIFRNR